MTSKTYFLSFFEQDKNAYFFSGFGRFYKNTENRPLSARRTVPCLPVETAPFSRFIY